MEVQAEYSSAGRRPDYLHNDECQRNGAIAAWRKTISATAMTEFRLGSIH